MSRPIKRLSARFVQTVTKAGMHADGGGLYLLVSKSGTRSWIFRYRTNGRLRDMGLGSAQDFSLAQARERAAQARRLRADGIDPLTHKAAMRAAQARLWGDAKREFIEARRSEWKNENQAKQWEQSLADYGPPDKLPVQTIDTDLVMECLRPLWKPKDQGGKLETATRVRGRIERIIDAEKVLGNFQGDNPARWRGHLEHLLPKAGKVQKKRHFPAMPYEQVPAFMVELRERVSLSRLALEFKLLTVGRTSEITGCQWSEIHLDRALWVIPGERMKMGEEHVVPLVPRAIEILRSRPRDRPPFDLSINAMRSLLQNNPPKGFGRPYTPHGFRSSFHDWASERDYGEHLIDIALAHKVSDDVKEAYRRTKLLQLRRNLMLRWAAYLDGADDPVPAYSESDLTEKAA